MTECKYSRTNLAFRGLTTICTLRRFRQADPSGEGFGGFQQYVLGIEEITAKVWKKGMLRESWA